MEEMREMGEETQTLYAGKQETDSGKLRRRRLRRQKRNRSLRHILYRCILICAALSFLGAMTIGVGTNYIQAWFRSNFRSIRLRDGGYYEIYVDSEGYAHTSYLEKEYVFNIADRSRPLRISYSVIYDVIGSLQFLLIPLWILACVGMTVWIFYKREVEKPLRVLREASEKIADNCLDFEIEPVKDNELGQLRDGFEKMRAALYENNRITWQQLEERKRLNAAFAHDMRTPITVLKGYGEMLERYVPEGRISQEKLLEVLGMMNGQIRRLESYTQKMGSIRKLEDLEPETSAVKAEDLQEKLRNMCGILGQTRIDISFSFEGEGILFLDEALVMEVCENLVSNAVRYAREKLWVTVQVVRGEGPISGEEPESCLEIAVEDDGPGFSPEDLQHAAEPFYRGAGQMAQSHFGLGLYICRLICHRCGGSLALSNGVCGGRVTARFEICCGVDKKLIDVR